MTALQISTLDTLTFNEDNSVKAFAIVERTACRLGAEGGPAQIAALRKLWGSLTAANGRRSSLRECGASHRPDTPRRR